MYSDISDFGHLFKAVLGKIAYKISGKLKNATIQIHPFKYLQDRE